MCRSHKVSRSIVIVVKECWKCNLLHRSWMKLHKLLYFDQTGGEMNNQFSTIIQAKNAHLSFYFIPSAFSFTARCFIYFSRIPFHKSVFSFVAKFQYHYIYALRSLPQWDLFLSIAIHLSIENDILSKRMSERTNIKPNESYRERKRERKRQQINRTTERERYGCCWVKKRASTIFKVGI